MQKANITRLFMYYCSGDQLGQTALCSIVQRPCSTTQLYVMAEM